MYIGTQSCIYNFYEQYLQSTQSSIHNLSEQHSLYISSQKILTSFILCTWTICISKKIVYQFIDKTLHYFLPDP